MNEKDHEDFDNPIKPEFVKKAHELGEVKAKDHKHIIGKYRGYAHQECNINLSLTKKNSFVFHNLQNYDSLLIFQEIKKYNFKINVIPKTIKRDMSFNIHEPKEKGMKLGLLLVFIDNIHF